MSRSDDHAYYALRAMEEMGHGDRAADASVAAIHFELAYRYSMLAARLRVEVPKLTLIDGGKVQLPRKADELLSASL